MSVRPYCHDCNHWGNDHWGPVENGVFSWNQHLRRLDKEAEIKWKHQHLKQEAEIKQKAANNSLEALLESVSVMAPGCYPIAAQSIGVWWAVCTDDDGIIAYFLNEEDAFRFRLSYINALLNPVKR
jgi:hypothetical protein